MLSDNFLLSVRVIVGFFPWWFVFSKPQSGDGTDVAESARAQLGFSTPCLRGLLFTYSWSNESSSSRAQ